jgi:hypothetical protein
MQLDYPAYTFIEGADFHWQPTTKTIHFVSGGDPAFLLHELAHAILDHTTYQQDIALIDIERDAWQLARTSLASKYLVLVSEATIEDALDTYRDWLHTRSSCPTCHATGVQTASHHYHCLVCNSDWRVNGALSCRLRRQKIQ